MGTQDELGDDFDAERLSETAKWKIKTVLTNVWANQPPSVRDILVASDLARGVTGFQAHVHPAGDTISFSRGGEVLSVVDRGWLLDDSDTESPGEWFDPEPPDTVPEEWT